VSGAGGGGRCWASVVTAGERPGRRAPSIVPAYPFQEPFARPSRQIVIEDTPVRRRLADNDLSTARTLTTPYIASLTVVGP